MRQPVAARVALEGVTTGDCVVRSTTVVYFRVYFLALLMHKVQREPSREKQTLKTNSGH
jgi:hypothetical protein